MPVEESTLNEIGAEFELIGENLRTTGRDLRSGTLEPRAAIEVRADEFKGLRAEFEVLTRKVESGG
jgi:hypothetical protein